MKVPRMIAFAMGFAILGVPIGYWTVYLIGVPWASVIKILITQ